MRTFPFLLACFTAVLGLTSGIPAAEPAADTRVFELRTYTATPGNLDKVLARFRDHTLEIFARHGMENIAYWVPAEAKDGAGEKLVYLIAHPSREAATANWAAFRADPEWKAVSAASEANGKIVAKTESVFLAATDFSPIPRANVVPGTPRVFELRTYTTPEGKLNALDARFRGRERALFTNSGMGHFGYFHPLDADKGAGHTLVYVLVHANRDAAVESWKKFRADPEWIALKAETEKNGSITTQTESVFLTPVDFSPTK